MPNTVFHWQKVIVLRNGPIWIMPPGTQDHEDIYPAVHWLPKESYYTRCLRPDGPFFCTDHKAFVTCQECLDVIARCPQGLSLDIPWGKEV